MLGYTPRVNGNSPGNPIDSDGGRSASVYSARIGSPESVENGTSRSVNCLSSVAMCPILGAGGLAQQRAGDHEPLDLARALVDLGDLRVAVVALGRELLRVAVAAEDLDRLAGLAARDRAREQLRLRTRLGVRPPLLLQPGSAEDEQPRRVELERHVR